MVGWLHGHEMWQVYTHLDVRGSDLYQQHEDAVALSHGKSIVKGTYDHQSGQFSERQVLDPSEYVVFSGLHSPKITLAVEISSHPLFERVVA